MFRCAGVVLVLASLLYFPDISAEPLDGGGLIGGQVTNAEYGNPLRLSELIVYPAGNSQDTIDVDTTDNDGRYALFIDLEQGQDEDTVDVYVHKDFYIDSVVTDIIIRNLEVREIDFPLLREARVCYGWIFDNVFLTGIEDVYVFTGDSATSEHTDPAGYYELHIGPPRTCTLSFTHPDFLPEEDVVILDSSRTGYNNGTIELEQIIWHVDSTLGSDETGDGRVLSPFLTFQKGIDFASTDDTVLVGRGTYTGDGNRGITVDDLQITIKSQKGPDSTFIDIDANAGNPQRAFTFKNVNALTVLEGFTIRNGYNTSGGAIHCFFSGSPTIRNCIFVDNTAESYGGAIDIGQNSAPIISNCRIIGNTAVFGGAIAVRNNSFPTIDSCVIDSNNATPGDGGGIYIYDSFARVSNCTIVRNWADSLRHGGGIYCNDGEPAAEIGRCILWYNEPDPIYTVNSDSIIVEYSDVQGGWAGTANIDSFPLFCNPNEGDFHLGINSPCYNYPLPGEYIGALGSCGDSVSIIYGWVTDAETFYPVEGASVEAISRNSGDAEANTNGDGYYELVFLTTGTDTADVLFDHPAYSALTVEDTVFTTGYSTELSVEMTTGCEYIPGDVNNNGDPLELADVITMIANYSGDESPSFFCACPPNGENFAATADPNGNCVAMEQADVIFEIAAYAGDVTPVGCEDCPGGQRMLPGNWEEPLVVPSLKSRVRANRSRSTE